MKKFLFLSVLILLVSNICLFSASGEGIPKINTDSIISSLNNKAFQLYKSGKYEESVKLLLELLEFRKKHTPDKIVNIVSNYLNISTTLRNIWDYDNALEYSSKAYDLIAKLDSTSLLYARSLSQIASIYIYIEDYEKALQFINISNNVFNRNKFEKENNLLTLEAVIQSSLKNYENSNNLWFEILKTSKNKYPIYNAIALNYIETGNLDEAARYQNLIFSLRELEESEMYRVYLNYGIFLVKASNKKDSVIHYYNLALANAEKFESRNNSLIAQIYQNFGEFYLREKDINKSLEYFQKALIRISQDFNVQDHLSNPDPESVDDKNRLYRILKLKAKTLFEYYLKYHDRRYLETSLEVSDICFSLINKMRYRITSEGSQFSISESENDIYSGAITTAFHLYEISGKDEYLEKAFQINESGKAFVLLSHLRKQRAMEYGKIPSNLLEMEKDLNRKLSFYEEQILAERQKPGPDQEKIRTWEEMTGSFNIEYDKLLRALEKNYPEYYNLKYRSEYITTRELKRKLGKNEAVVEYALVDTFLYTFVISKEVTKFYRLDAGEKLAQECNDFYRLITKQNFSKDVQGTFLAYTGQAYHLYNTLLEPFEEDVKDKSLIIIADGEISYLPFDALLTEKVISDELNYRDLPYLLKRHSVGFSYSSTMHFNHGIKRRASNKSVLAFAPTYGNLMDIVPSDSKREDHYNLIMLPGIRDEVRKIAKQVKTNIFLDFNALESNFKSEAPRYDILHLAMHTILNDKNPLYSRLAFTQLTDTIEDGFLHAYEIYNMQLKAKLTVLSSCSSGFGKLQEGEGMQSLARSFAYAGCPSILMTLWEVADLSTVRLMTDFYMFLGIGHFKPEALRLSKLNFIAKADHLKSNPFFWSSFIILGDSTPVYKQFDMINLLWFLPLPFFPFYFFYRKRVIRKCFGWGYM